jgi:excinuclease UvrABC nuclease subunit
VGKISQTEYQKTIKNIKLLFAGKKQKIIQNLEREMKSFAKKQEFEKAGKVRNQIFALNHIRDVALLKGTRGLTSEQPLEERPRVQIRAGRGESSSEPEVSPRGARIRIEAYDIAHLSGQKTVGAMAVWQDGELDSSEYRLFELKGAKSRQADDPANLQEILERRFNHPEWPWPDLIVVDGNQVQINVAEKVLGARGLLTVVRSRFSSEPEMRLRTTVVAVTKDVKHKASKILGDSRIIHDYHHAIVEVNAEAHRLALSYHRKKMRQIV